MQLVSVVTSCVRSDCEPQLLQILRLVELRSRLEIIAGNWKFVRIAFLFYRRNVGPQDIEKRVSCVSWIVFEIQGLLLQLFPS